MFQDHSDHLDGRGQPQWNSQPQITQGESLGLSRDLGYCCSGSGLTDKSNGSVTNELNNPWNGTVGAMLQIAPVLGQSQVS